MASLQYFWVHSLNFKSIELTIVSIEYLCDEHFWYKYKILDVECWLKNSLRVLVRNMRLNGFDRIQFTQNIVPLSMKNQRKLLRDKLLLKWDTESVIEESN